MPQNFESLVNIGIHIINQDRFVLDEIPMNLVISGVARSGTSLVAGTLHHLGVFMGNAGPPVYEDVELSQALENGNEETAKEIIQKYNGEYPIWGWKRPSSVNYLDSVDRYFNNPVYFFIFKDILSTAKRNQISMKSDVISDMRKSHRQLEKIIGFIEKHHPSAMLISYEKVLMNRYDFIQTLCDFIGITPSANQCKRAAAFIRPNPADYLDSTRITKARGRVGVVKDSLVAGWARAAHNDNPIKVELFVNEKKTAVTWADIYRKDLLEKGVHPTGRIGFRFDLTQEKKLKKGDVVRVRAENEVKDLNNCPQVFDG